MCEPLGHSMLGTVRHRILASVFVMACSPTYWRGPGDRGPTPEERLGPDAKIGVMVSWHMPAEDRARPEWLGQPGEFWSEELARRYGPKMFRNGRLPGVARHDFAIGASGRIELAGCAPIVALDRTRDALAAAIERCAARFVDDPRVSVEIDDNPAWSITIIGPERTRRVPLQIGMTLTGAVALAVGVEATRDHDVWLQVPGQPARPIDLEAIVEGKQPDISLRVGDLVRIE